MVRQGKFVLGWRIKGGFTSTITITITITITNTNH